MSKLGSLIAIPVSFALVKAIVNRIPEDTTPIVPIIQVIQITPITQIIQITAVIQISPIIQIHQ